MKTMKSILTLVVLLCLTCYSSHAQQMFLVHQDNVKPSKFMEYEKIAKEFNEACMTHNLQMEWFAASANDFSYYYITPIENFAELDKRPMEDMAKAMGDKFTDLFNRYDACYSSHGNYIVVSVDELSYMPEGASESLEGQNYRKWFFMYYPPKHAKKVKEGMKAVRDMFASKGSKQYYRVYRSGFGAMENYYMVSVASKDEIEGAKEAKANNDVLGPERWETFSKVMNYISRMEEYSGEMRPDLSYSPK